MYDRRRVLAVSGAALAAGAFGCAPKPDETASGPAPGAPDAAPDPQQAATVDPATAAEDEEFRREFIAESLSENEATPGSTATTVSSIVTSAVELENNPSLLRALNTIKREVKDKVTVAVAVLDGESPDYHCIVHDNAWGADGSLSPSAFTLTGDVLKSIATSASYFTTIQGKKTVLFGIRGCGFDTGSPRSGTAIKVKEQTIDHVGRLCLIGAWQPATGEIWAFEGSTVPNLVNMQMHLFFHWTRTTQLKNVPKIEELMCGQMPAGLHRYEVGTHRRSAKTYDLRYPGSILQVSESPVLRAQKDLHYKVTDAWDPLQYQSPGYRDKGDRFMRVTNCNIHAGLRNTDPKFSSQGCQTIEGMYEPKGVKATGRFAEFQNTLGITILPDGPDKYKSSADTTPYFYMLTSGREARLHAQNAGNADAIKRLARVRIGSTGAVATRVRPLIGLDAGDTIDALAMNEILRMQDRRGVPLDGVITPALADELKLAIFT